MKKIINGLRFDTETAIEIGSYQYDYPGNFQYWEATLYKTPKSGTFFIAGSGGAMSRFSQSIGQNEWSGGSDLIPMTEAEAQEWAEEYLDPAIVEKHFTVQDA